MKLAIQEVGRKLGSYVNKKKRVGSELKKRDYIQKYIPHVAEALKELLELEENKKENIELHLKAILEQERGELKDMKFDPTKNVDFDKKLANIGKDDSE